MSEPLPPDQQLWLRHAQEILDGKFDKATESTIKSLTIGLRSIDHPLAKAAMKKLEEMAK